MDKSMKCVYDKHSYTEFFIAALYNAGYNNAQAQANNYIQYNSLHTQE